MRKVLYIWLLFTIVICYSTDAAFETSFVPVRNQALAYSTSELFDWDINVVPSSQISTSRMHVVPLEIERLNISVGHSASRFSISLTGDYFGTKDIAPDLNYSEYIKAIKASYQAKTKLKVGMQIKNYQLTSVYDGGGFGIDLGLQTKLLPQLNVTLELRDLANKVYYSTGKVEKKPPRTVVLAECNFKKNSSLYLAFEDGKIAIGNEFSPVAGFAIRIGLNDRYWSGGVGIDKNKWRFEYALYNSLLGNQQSMSIQRTF